MSVSIIKAGNGFIVNADIVTITIKKVDLGEA